MKTTILSLNVDKSMSFARFQARIESSLNNFTDGVIRTKQFEEIIKNENVRVVNYNTGKEILNIDGYVWRISEHVYAKFVSSKKKKEEAPEEPKGPTTEELLTEIRDLLSEKK